MTLHKLIDNMKKYKIKKSQNRKKIREEIWYKNKMKRLICRIQSMSYTETA